MNNKNPSNHAFSLHIVFYIGWILCPFFNLVFTIKLKWSGFAAFLFIDVFSTHFLLSLQFSKVYFDVSIHDQNASSKFKWVKRHWILSTNLIWSLDSYSDIKIKHNISANRDKWHWKERVEHWGFVVICLTAPCAGVCTKEIFGWCVHR